MQKVQDTINYSQTEIESIRSKAKPFFSFFRGRCFKVQESNRTQYINIEKYCVEIAKIETSRRLECNGSLKQKLSPTRTWYQYLVSDDRIKILSSDKVLYLDRKEYESLSTEEKHLIDLPKKVNEIFSEVLSLSLHRRKPTDSFSTLSAISGQISQKIGTSIVEDRKSSSLTDLESDDDSSISSEQVSIQEYEVLSDVVSSQDPEESPMEEESESDISSDIEHFQPVFQTENDPVASPSRKDLWGEYELEDRLEELENTLTSLKTSLGDERSQALDLIDSDATITDPTELSYFQTKQSISILEQTQKNVKEIKPTQTDKKELLKKETKKAVRFSDSTEIVARTSKNTSLENTSKTLIISYLNSSGPYLGGEERKERGLKINSRHPQDLLTATKTLERMLVPENSDSSNIETITLDEFIEDLSNRVLPNRKNRFAYLRSDYPNCLHHILNHQKIETCEDLIREWGKYGWENTKNGVIEDEVFHDNLNILLEDKTAIENWLRHFNEINQ